MSDSVPALPPCLAFTYREVEMRRFRELATRTLARVLPWHSFWIVVGGSIFVIGLAVLGAQKGGLISVAEVRPVLFTAYLAFYGGIGMHTLLIIRRYCDAAGVAVKDGGRSNDIWNVEFSDDGMTWKSDFLESRVAWSAVQSVDSPPDGVLIWLLQMQYLAIPARVFADDAARLAFVAAVRARIPANARQG
jgi:YcxB-like protein